MKYSSKTTKATKKLNIFERNKRLKNEIISTSKKIRRLEKQLQNAREHDRYYGANSIKKELIDYKNRLKYLNNERSKITKTFVKLGATLGLTLTVATASFGAHKSNKEFENNIIDSYNIMELDDNKTSYSIENDSDLLYEQLKNDIEDYTKISQKEHLSHEDKEHLASLKSRINSNPEGLTRLSLDILKQKIANSLDIEDASKISIKDKSTQVRADRYNPETGTITDISISFDGKTIASLEQFQNLSNGEIRTSSNDIPKDILNTIYKIVDAQSNPQDTKKATKALKSSLNLNEKDISFESEQDNER